MIYKQIIPNTSFCLHWNLSSSVADPRHVSVELDPDADPCLWLMDPDQDPSIFIINLQDPNKKLILKKSFSASYFLKEHLRHFLKLKGKKKSQNSMS